MTFLKRLGVFVLAFFGLGIVLFGLIAAGIVEEGTGLYSALTIAVFVGAVVIAARWQPRT